MQLRVNGEDRTLEKPLSIAEFLALHQLVAKFDGPINENAVFPTFDLNGITEIAIDVEGVDFINSDAGKACCVQAGDVKDDVVVLGPGTGGGLRKEDKDLLAKINAAIKAIRASGEYESRGEAMASDLADGLTPETVRTYRRAILRLRKDPSLMTEVYKRKDAVYEKILPGYGAKMRDVPGGTYFVIGAEKQMAAYESYLQSKEGADTKLVRIYPRDFWME